MSAPNPSVEAIVAVVLEYHRPNATLRCIKSLAEAGIEEILIWDNSTDAGVTRAALTKEIANDIVLGKRVSIDGNNINYGFSAGINAAISRITDQKKNRYFLLINNDATINPEGVTALLQTLLSDPKNVIAAPKYLNSGNKSPALMYYHPWLAMLTEKKHVGSFAFLSGCCLLVDIENSGTPLLDESFFMYGEDIALSRKIQKDGFRLAIAEAACVEHAGAASSIVGSAFYEYHVAHGHVLLTSRVASSGWSALVSWPTRLASLVARSLVRCFRAKNTTPVWALWRALFGLGVD